MREVSVRQGICGVFTRKIATSIERDGKCYFVEVALRCHPGDPGRTYGEPEDCYPPEPAFGEIEDIVVLEAEDDECLVGQHVDWDIDPDDLLHAAIEAHEEEREAMREAEWERRLELRREG
jgi:hypothetical protein